MLEEHENVDTAKCDIRLCRCLVIQKFKCSKCGRACHWACYNGIVLAVKDKAPLVALPEGLIACTKKCYAIAAKDSNGSQRGDWKNDGKPDTPHLTSIKLLLDWWLEHPKYEIFCGKHNDGVKKITVCKGLAKDMRELTTSTQRTGENVQSKIAHMESDFRKTHEWSTGETGAGILEKDGELTWKDALTNMFEYYFDLLPIMGDRASSQPKFTNSNPADLDADPDEEASFHPCDNAETESVAGSDSGSVVVVAAAAADKPANKKTRNRGGIRGPSPLMDAKTVEMFESASMTSEGKLAEMERHNAAVESNNAALLLIAQSKARAEGMKNKYDYVKGRVALVAQYKELKDQGLSNNQIVAFIPHLKDVVDMMNCEPAFMNRKRSAEEQEDDDDSE